MNIKILQAENSIENVSNSVLSALYNAHINGDISLEVDNNNQKVGLIGSIQVDVGYEYWISALTSAYPKFHASCNTYYILFYHLEIENAIITWALLNPNNVGANFASGGHITQDDADSLTQWSKTFTGNTNITQFNEFEKFRNVIRVSLNDCFLGCTNLLSIKLPPRLTNIRGWMFNGCSSLSGVVLPASCTTIDTSGFAGCTSLTSIDLSNVLTIGMKAFYKSGLSGVLSLPSLMLLNDREAFADCIGLTEVSELGHVSSVIWSTFAGCSNITKVALPPTCTSLGNAAFENCHKLSSINLSNILSLGDNVFKNDTSLTGELNLPNLSSWDSWAFANTRISSIISLGSVTKIAARVFCDCVLLTSVTLSSSIKTIDAYGFCNCTNLTSLDVSNITTFVQGALKNTRITSLDLSSAINIGSEAFSDNPALTTVTGTSNLISIGSNAFNNTRISSIDLTGSTITSLPVGVFLNCTNLSKIKLPTTVTYLNEQWSRNISSTLYISGLDNVSDHSTHSWAISNTSILNPIKTSLVTGDSIVCWSNNSRVIRVHSYYEPLRTSTRQNDMVSYGAPKNTSFIYDCLGGAGSFTIGLLYYRDIASFGTATFFRCNIENLVINNSTPPVLDNSDTTFSGEDYWLNWGNSIFGNLSTSSDGALQNHAIIGTLWVPDSAVATYQADPLYSSLTIKGINTKTNGTDYDLPRYADFAAWEAAEEAAVAQGGHAPQGLIEAWM